MPAPPSPRPVTVILGDPRLPDAVKLGGQFNEEDLEAVRKLKAALDELPGYSFTYRDDHTTLIHGLLADPPGFVLNLCDEGYFNDAPRELHVPALLEMLNVAYTGCPPACLAVCYDKATVRAVARDLGVPVPAQTILEADDDPASPTTPARVPGAFPALLKPACGDGSIGITADGVVHTDDELHAAAERIRAEWPGRAILVQEFLPGAEYTVGLIGNPSGFTVLPVLEVDYSGLPDDLPPILGYESKWDPESPYWNDVGYRRAELSDDVRRTLVRQSERLFERLDCRDYARMDFRCGTDGVPRLLEVNPNPGWVWDGKFNLMAGMADLTYADMLRLILEAAESRLGV